MSSMPMYITDPLIIQQIKEDRERTGSARHDEIWNGIYFIPPFVDIEHQEIVARVACAFFLILGDDSRATVLMGANISDREDDWMQNLRIPDILVVLSDGRAINRDTHFFGGPDLVLDVLTKDDRAREKLPFYASIGVRELLHVDREPWALEHYRLEKDTLVLVGRSTTETHSVLQCEVVPASLRMVAGDARPTIEIRENGGKRLFNA